MYAMDTVHKCHKCAFLLATVAMPIDSAYSAHNACRLCLCAEYYAGKGRQQVHAWCIAVRDANAVLKPIFCQVRLICCALQIAQVPRSRDVVILCSLLERTNYQ